MVPSRFIVCNGNVKGFTHSFALAGQLQEANGKIAAVYLRDVDLRNGTSAKEFLFVEMNWDTRCFQLWRGRGESFS